VNIHEFSKVLLRYLPISILDPDIAFYLNADPDPPNQCGCMRFLSDFGVTNKKLDSDMKNILSVAAGLSNRPDARSTIAVGAMGLPPLHVVCGGAGQLWIPRT
jgi:hypothetical protein